MHLALQVSTTNLVLAAAKQLLQYLLLLTTYCYHCTTYRRVAHNMSLGLRGWTGNYQVRAGREAP